MESSRDKHRGSNKQLSLFVDVDAEQGNFVRLQFCETLKSSSTCKSERDKG